MIRISWTEKKSNEEVLREAGRQRTMMKRIRQWQLVFHHEKTQSGKFGGNWKDIRKECKGASETEVSG